MDLESKIEAILFWKGEPVSLKKLGELIKVSPGELLEAIASLKQNLAGRGIVLMEHDDDITLGTAPELSDMIEALQKEELNKDLSKATLEALSIILYKNGASRADIDNIRGVNSSFTLRALAVRGLVERTIDPDDSRRYIYKPSLELLSYMGLKSIDELPEYGDINKSIETVATDLAEQLSDEAKN